MVDILVTAFGAFGNHKVNASSIVLNRLKQESWPDLLMHFEQFPVEFDFVAKRLPELKVEIAPKLSIHIGVSLPGTPVCLERVAYNKDICQKDIKGIIPNNGCLQVEGCDKLKTDLDVERVIELLDDECRQMVALSSDPGRFVCNACYYFSLECSKRAIFIHIPPLNNPYSECQLVSCVKAVILALYKQV